MRAYLLVALLGVELLAYSRSANAWQTRFLGDRLYASLTGANALALEANGDVVAVGSASVGDVDFLVTRLSASRGRPVWTSRIDGNGLTSDVAYAVALSSDGDVVAGGVVLGPAGTDSFTVVKLAGASGAVCWQKAVQGGHGVDDVALAIAVDPTGAVLAAGRMYMYPSSFVQLAVVKLSGSDGSESWRYILDGSGLYDKFDAVSVDAAGDVLAAGALCADPYPCTDQQLIVVKLSGVDGHEMWRTEVPSSAYPTPWKLGVDASDDVVVTGGMGQDLTVMKLDGTDGAQIWRHDVTDGHGTSVAFDAAGNVVVAGAVSFHFAVLKLARDDGAEVWQRLFDPPGSGEGAAVVVDAAGDVLAAGGIDIWFVVAKLAGDTGIVQSTWEFDGGGSHQSGETNFARAILGDGAGGIVAAGTLIDQASGRQQDTADFFVVKLSDRLTGKLLSLTDPPGRPEARRLTLTSGDRSLEVGSSETANDPTQQGATLELRNPTTSEQVAIPLPAAGWKKIGGSFGYADPTLTAGPCRKVSLRNGTGLTAKCEGSQLAFSLDEPSQGALAARLTVGSAHYCLRFGGKVTTDVPGRFKASAAPAPVSCP